MLRSILRLPAAVAMAIALSSGTLAAQTPPDTVVIARNLTASKTLDPHEIYEIANSELVRSLYSRIVDLDPETFSRVVPGVAKSWAVSDGGRTYTFTIDTTQKFHSGRNVTAEDVAWSLQRTATLAKPLSFIVTQFGLNAETAKDLIRAEGDTVIVTLPTAYAPDLFLNALTSSNGSVVDKETVLQHEKDGDWGNGWLTTNAAGSGAYRLVNYTPKEAAVIEANPDFYLGAPKTNRIIVRSVAEPGAQRLLLEKGDIDIAQDLSPDQIEALAGNPDIRIDRIPIGTTFYLGLSQKHPILSKPEVWEAFRYLVDYRALSEDLLKGAYGITQSFLSPGVNGALEDQPYSYDPERARALLAKAGYPDGFDLTMDVTISGPIVAVSEALQASFAAGGVRLKLDIGEPITVLTNFRNGDFDFILFIKSIDYNDPNAMTSYFARNDANSPVGPERTGWRIPELTAKTYAAAIEQDPAVRRALYDDLQHEIRDNSPFIFVLRQITQIGSRNNVSGFRAGVPFDSGIYHLIEKTPK